MIYVPYPPNLFPSGFRVTRGENDLLFTEDGRRYIDLLSGSGTVFLGHANPIIGRQIKDQLDAVWNVAALPTRLAGDVSMAIDEFFPASHAVSALYSTGMEAVEFALRVARHVTGRKTIVGFNGCMHGKSMAAANLGWRDDLVSLPDIRRLTYLPEQSEADVLDAVERTLAGDAVAAVILEPLLGSRGGYVPSKSFATRLSAVCRLHGSLLIIDEVFTGFYRTGPAFLHHDLGVTPDIVLIGKALGNGFPVSGVVVDRRLDIRPTMLPGSTFAANPLALAAVGATLSVMRTHDLPERVERIAQVIRASLGDLATSGIALRGKGALWVLEFPPSVRVPDLVARILGRGVVVSTTAAFVRLLPPATVSLDNLTNACHVVRDVCLESISGAPARDV